LNLRFCNTGVWNAFIIAWDYLFRRTLFGETDYKIKIARHLSGLITGMLPGS